MADRERELSTLLSSAILVMAGGIIGSAAKLGERVVIGRLLTPDAYGEVSIGLAFFTFTITLALVGCTQGVSRFIPRYDSLEDRRGLLVSGMAITTVLSLVIAIGMFIGAGWLSAVFFETEAAITFIQVLAVTLPFAVGFRMLIAAIRGCENTLYRTIVNDLVDPGLRIALIGGLLLAGMGIVAAGIAYLIAAIVAFLIALVFLHRLMPLFGAYRTHTKELFIFSAPLAISTVIGTLLTQTDTLMLGHFRSSYEVGMYNAAYPLAGGLLVVLSAFGFLYLPIISRLDSEGERGAVNDIYATTTKWVYIITFPAFLLFVVFPEGVIHTFFGQNYTDAAPALPILALGFFASATVGRDRETLSALGSTSWIAIGNIVGLVVNVVINLVLIPRYGFIGASVASVISLLGVHAVICGVLAIQYDITPLSPESTRTFIALPLVLLPVGAVVSPWISISMVTVLPFLVVTGLCSIAVVGLVDAFEADDIVIIDLIEDAAGFSIPLVRRWIPDSSKETGLSAD